VGIDTDRGFETDVFGNPGFYVWGHEQQVSYDSTGFMRLQRPRGRKRRRRRRRLSLFVV